MKLELSAYTTIPAEAIIQGTENDCGDITDSFNDTPSFQVATQKQLIHSIPKLIKNLSMQPNRMCSQYCQANKSSITKDAQLLTNVIGKIPILVKYIFCFN